MLFSNVWQRFILIFKTTSLMSLWLNNFVNICFSCVVLFSPVQEHTETNKHSYSHRVNSPVYTAHGKPEYVENKMKQKNTCGKNKHSRIHWWLSVKVFRLRYRTLAQGCLHFICLGGYFLNNQDKVIIYVIKYTFAHKIVFKYTSIVY